jgi:predicted Zn finger-like uncharacterized protein
MEAEIGDLGRRFAGASDSTVMILTCPECATSYFVDDARVPAAGRLVKCTSCGARWTAVHEAPPEPEPTRPTPAPASEPEPPFVAAPADDLEVVPIEPAAASAAPPFRRPYVAPRKEAAGKVVILAVAAAGIVALLAGAIVFRDAVVRALPATQGAFAGIGLPVNTLGLAIENVRAQPVFQGGRPVLAVTGAIRNLREEAASAPPIRMSLLDRAGKPVAVKVATPLDDRVPGHAVRHFAITLVDPPASAEDLEVTFEAGREVAPSAGAALGAPAANAPPPSAAGPSPVEAQPLPPGSQDALPQHD